MRGACFNGIQPWRVQLSLNTGLAQPRHQRSLPELEGFFHVDIAINSTAETVPAERSEFCVKLAAKLAKVLIVPIAKCQHCIKEILETRKVFEA